MDDMRRRRGRVRENPPSFILKPKSRQIDEGTEVKFRASIDGEPTPTVRWTKNGVTVEEDYRTSFIEKDTFRYLTINNVQMTDQGTISCTITNNQGECSESAKLEVIERPELRRHRSIQRDISPAESRVAYKSPSPVRGRPSIRNIVRDPSPVPIREPSPEPIRDPSPEPIREPSPEPIREPSPEPIREPSPEPIREPSPEPIREPSPEPKREHSPEPIREPSPEPIRDPSPEPSRDKVEKKNTKPSSLHLSSNSDRRSTGRGRTPSPSSSKPLSPCTTSVANSRSRGTTPGRRSYECATKSSAMREKPRTFPSKLTSGLTANSTGAGSLSSPSKEQSSRKSPSPTAANAQRRLSNGRSTRSNGTSSKPNSREELHTASTTSSTTTTKSTARGKSPSSKESLTSKTTARLEKQASLHADRSQGRRPASPMRAAVTVKSSVRDSPFRQSDTSGDPVQSNSHRSHRHNSSNHNATPVIKSRTPAASVQNRAAQFSGKTNNTQSVSLQNGRTKNTPVTNSVAEVKKTSRVNSADRQKNSSPSITSSQTNNTTTTTATTTSSARVNTAPIENKTSRANIEIKMNKANESNMVVEVEINSGAVQNVTVVSQSSPPMSQDPVALVKPAVSASLPREKSAQQKRKLEEDLAALQKERDLDLEQREQRELRRRQREERREQELQQQMEKDVKQGVLGRYDPTKSRPSHTPTANTSVIATRIADTKLLFAEQNSSAGGGSNTIGKELSPRASPLPARSKANSKFSEMQSRFNSSQSKEPSRPNSSYSKSSNKVVLPGKFISTADTTNTTTSATASFKDKSVTSVKIECAKVNRDQVKPVYLNNNDHTLADAETNGAGVADECPVEFAGSSDLQPLTSTASVVVAPAVEVEEQEEEPVAARIISGLQDSIAMDGDRVELVTTIVGSEPLDVYWLFNGDIITEADNQIYEMQSPETNIRKLIIHEAYPEISGVYACGVYNNYGDGDSCCKLTVTDTSGGVSIAAEEEEINKENVDDFAPEFIVKPSPQTVEEGKSISFQFDIDSSPEANVEWTKEGITLKSTHRFKITSTETIYKLEIKDCVPSDAGRYVCVACNAKGESKAGVSLTVNAKQKRANQSSKETKGDFRFVLNKTKSKTSAPSTGTTANAANEASQKDFRSVLKRHVTTKRQPRINTGLKDVSITPRQTCSLRCGVDGIPLPNIQWTLNGLPVKEDGRILSNYDNEIATLSIDHVTECDAGTYVCTAINEAGNASSQCNLIVIASKGLRSQASIDCENLAGTSSPTANPAPIPAPSALTKAPVVDMPVSGGHAPRLLGPAHEDHVVLLQDDLLLKSSFKASGDFDIMWSRLSKPHKSLERVDRVDICCENDMTLLLLSKARITDDDTYLLTISNDRGKSQKKFVVSVQGVPDSPVTPTLEILANDSLKLKWNRPDFTGNSTILSYRVQQSYDGVKWNTLNDTCKDTTLEVKETQACKFRVCSRNKHGYSSSSAIVTFEPVEEIKRRPIALDDDSRQFSDFYTYEADNPIASGNFGTVYHCTEKATGTKLAVKFIKTLRQQQKEDVKKEIRIMSKLSHPKLLLLWDAFQEKKHIKIVMEYISCGELFERISEDSYTLTEAKGITYMKQICTAIQYMHSLNILHLDLKAENILCVSVNSEDIKVIDFGLSQEFPVNNNKFVVPIAGTADFMSPEVIGNDPADLKTDCWSVGVLCYCILSGCLPFRGDDDNETIVNITRGDYDFDYEEFDSITDNAKDFICKLLQREKGNRMSMTDCLNHKWLTQSKASEVKLSNEKHKKLSSKWKKVHLMLRAAGRISQIRNMMSAARSLSDDEDVKIVTRAPSFECRMSDVEVDVGETATFKVQVTEGSCVQSFKWLREVSKTKRIELENNDKFKMSISANVATLQISKCLMSDNDGYMCQAMNSSGMVSCSADLYVNED